MPTFLALPHDLGGTTFGPFDQATIAVGTDPDRCQLVLSPGEGLFGVHAWISPTGTSWTVQAATRGASLFLRRGPRVTAVTAPVQAFPGDVLSLGRQDGPVRFEIKGSPELPSKVAAVQPIEPVASVGAAAPTPPPAAGAQPASPPRKGGRRGMPSADEMRAEAKRQAGVAAFSSGPIAFLNQLIFRGRSGALLQPRYVVGAVVALVVGAFSGCAGLAAALSQLLE